MRYWAALGLAMLYPTLLAWVYFVALARTSSQDRSTVSSAAKHNPTVVAAYTLGKLVQFALPLLWLWRVERRGIRLTRPTSRGLGRGLAFGLAVWVGTFALYELLRRHTTLLNGMAARLHAKIQEFGLEIPVAYILFAAFLCVVHSLLEEYYWRWFIFGRLRQRIPLSGAIVLSSLAFMAHHVVILAVFLPGRFWVLALPLAAGVAVGGAFWAWLYERSETLYAPWLSHAIVDGGIMAVGYQMLFGQSV
jgi:membrane protease YdiL (CAAX protease family)